MIKVNMLFAAGVFALAGLFILALFAWTEAAKYAHQLQPMRRLVAAARRAPLAISRVNSRSDHANSLRVA